MSRLLTTLPRWRPGGTRRPVVAALVANARLVLERHLGRLGRRELSNVSRAASGHVYFTLKDASAQVKCVLWRSKAQFVDFPCATVSVEVRALPSMYDPRGEFQLNVDAVRHAGLGALYERFAKLKARARRRRLARVRAQAAVAALSGKRRHRHVSARCGGVRRADDAQTTLAGAAGNHLSGISAGRRRSRRRDRASRSGLRTHAPKSTS